MKTTVQKIEHPTRYGFTEFLKAYVYTMIGLAISLLSVTFGLPVVFLMALGRGGFSKYLAFIAVGLVIGPLIGLVSGLTASVTSFLPGILGQVVGWILLGWIIVLAVEMILRFTGGRGK